MDVTARAERISELRRKIGEASRELGVLESEIRDEEDAAGGIECPVCGGWVHHRDMDVCMGCGWDRWV